MLQWKLAKSFFLLLLNFILSNENVFFLGL